MKVKNKPVKSKLIIESFFAYLGGEGKFKQKKTK